VPLSSAPTQSSDVTLDPATDGHGGLIIKQRNGLVQVPPVSEISTSVAERFVCPMSS
jgi:hypothetical protein